MSSNKLAHMAENLALFGSAAFTLSDDEVKAIANVPRPVENKVSVRVRWCALVCVSVRVR